MKLRIAGIVDSSQVHRTALGLELRVPNFSAVQRCEGRQDSRRE